jgi:2-C-methyl-D-erythritol 4-phosphate cytidylyltransferase
MVFAVICAGGIGSRMGNAEKPKQYLNVGGKPIILHTIEKFVVNEEFEKIIVLVPESWISYTKDIINKHLQGIEKVEVMAGGSDRNSTIMNAINYIEEKFGLDDDTIIVTHDAVRPFVTHRIIMDNIEAAVKVGACDTVIPATDTIVESLDGEKISSIPDRSKVYQGQTPQSFRAKRLKELYSSLTDEEKSILTDAAKIYLLKGEAVHLVRGEVFNIKITYPYDLTVAETLINTDRE